MQAGRACYEENLRCAPCIRAEQHTYDLRDLTSRSGMSIRICLPCQIIAGYACWFLKRAHDRVPPPFAGEVSLGHHSNQESLITSIVFCGTMVGAYSWGVLGDAKGRRVGFFGTAIFTFIFGLLSAASPNYMVSLCRVADLASVLLSIVQDLG